MSAIPTVPMVDPNSGVSADVPLDKVQDLLSKGGKLAAHMVDPESGASAYVAHDMIGAMRAKGAKLASEIPTQFENDQKPALTSERKQNLISGAQGMSQAAGNYQIGAAKQLAAPAGMIAGWIHGSDDPGVKALQKYIEPQGIAQNAGSAAEMGTELVVPGTGVKRAASTVLPSAARAGENFQEVMGAAKNVPIALNNAAEGALDLVDWQKKTQLGPTVNKFLNRITNPKLGPLTYEEGRDFYQLLGKLSAEESGKLAPAVRADLTKMVVGLRQDLGDAAGTVGKLSQYENAMQEFHNAMKLKAAAIGGAKLAGKAVAGATIGAGAKLAYDYLK